MAGKRSEQPSRSKTLKAYVDDAKYDEVYAHAAEIGISGSEFVRQAVDEKIEGSIEEALLGRVIQRLAPVVMHPETQQLLRLLIERHLRQ